MKKDPMVTLVNMFTLKDGVSPERFEEEFTKVGSYFAKQPGFLSYVLSQNIEDPFSYVNVALWADVRNLQDAVNLDVFSDVVAQIRTLSTSRGTVFRERRRFISEGIHEY